MDILLGTGLRLTGIGSEEPVEGFWSDDEHEDGEEFLPEFQLEEQRPDEDVFLFRDWRPSGAL